MKKNRIFTSVLAMALVLIALIIVVIIVGLFRPDREETLEGQAETTDYRLSSKVPARVMEIGEGGRLRTPRRHACRT